MRLLKSCMAPPMARVYYMLIASKYEDAYQWTQIPSMRGASLCRSFYSFLYHDDAGFERVKRGLNKEFGFVVYDPDAHAVFIIFKDSTYDDEQVLDSAHRVQIPFELSRLIREPPYRRYVPAAILGAAAVAGGAYAWSKWKSPAVHNAVGFRTRKANEPVVFFQGSNIPTYFDPKNYDVSICIKEGNYISTIMMTMAFYYFKVMTNSVGVFLYHNYIRMPWFEPAKRGPTRDHVKEQEQFYTDLDNFLTHTPPNAVCTVAYLGLPGHACLLVLDCKEKRLEFYDPNGRDAVYTVGQVNPSSHTAYAYFLRNRTVLHQKYEKWFDRIWSPKHTFQKETASCGLWSSVLAMCRMSGVPRDMLPTDIAKITHISSTVRNLLISECRLSQFKQGDVSHEMYDAALSACRVPDEPRHDLCVLVSTRNAVQAIPPDCMLVIEEPPKVPITPQVFPKAPIVPHKPLKVPDAPPVHEPKMPAIIYVSGDSPHTFWSANPAQVNALTAIATKMDDVEFPFKYNQPGFKFDMYVAQLDKFDDNATLYYANRKSNVWGESQRHLTKEEIEALPSVFCYENADKKMRYFRNNEEAPVHQWHLNQDGKTLYRESIPPRPCKEPFKMASDLCASTLVDFSGVGKLRNVFEIATKHTADVVAKMKECCILRSAIVEMLLHEAIETISRSNHPLCNVYKRCGSWQELAQRLLTKRVLWYYGGSNQWGCFIDNEFHGGTHADYMHFIRNRLDSYLHPDEAVLSSLLGLKVPSFAYDDGKRSNNCNSATIQGDVVMLAQVGARLEKHVHPERGDSFLINQNQITEFQILVHKHLRLINNNVYVARCTLILQQAIHCAVTHTCDVNLVITGLGLGYWAGDDKVARTQEFATALLNVIGRLSGAGSLTGIRLAVEIDDDNLEKIEAVCGAKGIGFRTIGQEEAPFSFQKRVVDMFSFAWDGMSLVGNEYYNASGTNSADPAAACSTSIPFFAHPKINPQMYTRFSPM